MENKKKESNFGDSIIKSFNIMSSAKTMFGVKEEPKQDLDCPYDFTSRCTMGRCDCKPKQETIEKAAERLQKDKYGIFISKDSDVKGQLVIDTAKAAFNSGMIEGAKYQAKRMYNEEDLKSAFFNGGNMKDMEEFKHWFEQIKKK
jgi:hypothetical protein